MIDAETQNTADLYRLALLLTGRCDLSIDIAADAVVSPEAGGSRRTVIGKALAAIRAELDTSASRTRTADVHKSAAAPRGWSLPVGATRALIENALLAIGAFPRAAVLLLIFEGVRLAEAAALLNADAALVWKAQAIGLREFTANLAAWKPQTSIGPSPLPASI